MLLTETQTVHFFGNRGDGTASTTRKVTAVPVAGQVFDTSLVDTHKVEAALAEGAADLDLLKGILYTITATWWGPPVDILITDADEADFSDYAINAVTGVQQSIVGSLRFGDRFIRPTLTDADGNAVALGSGISIDGLTLGWEIV